MKPMEYKKRYFGNLGLKNTVINVKSNFDCSVFFTEDMNDKYVSFSFTPEKRKEYNLSETIKKYQFINNHLILSNGILNPFKYDKLDAFIEQTELQYDVDKKIDSYEKIQRAINSCLDFYNNAIITIGNVKDKDCDVSFILNDIERFYHIPVDEKEIHLQKLPDNTVLANSKQFKMNQLPQTIQFKILKTTHPGLLTSATEYICGIRDDKTNWDSITDAYSKSWKKDIYKTMGIDTFDVLVDVNDSVLVGKFAENPMRHLILIDGQQFAYKENPLEIIPFDEYLKEKNDILNQYKHDIMTVLKETGAIPQTIIDTMNIYQGKTGPVIFSDVDTAIGIIRKENILNPLKNSVEKLNRIIKLYNVDKGFLVALRKTGFKKDVKRLDINENGIVNKVEVNLNTLEISQPFVVVGLNKKYSNKKRFPLTMKFIESLSKELKTTKDTFEYKFYIFSNKMTENGFNVNDISIQNKKEILVDFNINNTNKHIYINPYNMTLSANFKVDNEDYDIQNQYNVFINSFKEIFY